MRFLETFKILSIFFKMYGALRFLDSRKEGFKTVSMSWETKNLTPYALRPIFAFTLKMSQYARLTILWLACLHYSQSGL